jgi:hypothetical protein
MRIEVFWILFFKKVRKGWCRSGCVKFEKIEVIFWQYERDIKNPQILITSNQQVIIKR